MRKIMGRDQIVSDWAVAIHIKGNISFEQDKLKIDDLVLYHENNGKVVAKITVKDRSENDARIEAIKRVNRVLDKIAFEQNAPIRIEKSGIKGSRISEPIGETTGGEIIVAWVDFTIEVNHQIDQNTLDNAARLLSDIQDEVKKHIFKKALGHYRNGLNAESDGNPSAFLDFWDSIEIIASKYGKGSHIKDKIYDCFGKCFGERKESKVKKCYEIRQDAAHGLKDVSDPEEIYLMIKRTPQMKELAREFLEAWSG